jgi:hypothetical protein
VKYESVRDQDAGDIAIDDVDLELNACNQQPTGGPGPITTAGPPTHGLLSLIFFLQFYSSFLAEIRNDLMKACHSN